jgi:glycosyltransferase involved in cell wall biosynthesis
VSEEFGPNLPRCKGAPPNYFLFVGARGGYKSAQLAISAFASLPKSENTPQRVFAGGGPLSKKELTYISKLGVEAQVLQMSVSDAELPLLYSNSVALLYPTTHEGFGLPLVEAMASGVPIVAADTPINLEIAGDVANYFRVGNAGSMAQQMMSVMLNQESQRHKIVEGLNRSKSFTWLECARKTAEVYKALMRENVKH